MLNTVCKRMTRLWQPTSYSFSSGATFLSMVEGFFDRAAIHTGIRADRLAFYKKAESVVKCSIPLVKGTFYLIKITALSKPSQLTDANIKLTNSQLRVAHDTPRMWTSRKLRP